MGVSKHGLSTSRRPLAASLFDVRVRDSEAARNIADVKALNSA